MLFKCDYRYILLYLLYVLNIKFRNIYQFIAIFCGTGKNYISVGIVSTYCTEKQREI